MPSQVGTAVLEDSASIQVTIRVLDDPTGAPELAVNSNTAGIQFYFWRRGSLLSSFDLVSTLGGLASAHDEGGITSILNGYHRLDVPNSAFSAGTSAVFIGGVMTSGIIIGQEFQLVAKQVDDLNDVPLTAFDGVTVSALGNDVIGSAVIAAGAIDKGDQLIGLNDLSAAQVNAQADQALTDYDPATHTELIGEIDAVQSDIAGLVDITLNEVSTIVTSALLDIHLDHLLAVAAPTNSIVNSSVLALMAATNGTWSLFDESTDALQAIRDNQAGSDLAAIASAVWSLPLVGFVTAGTAGANLLSAMNLTSSILEDTNSTLSSQLILILEDTNSTLSSQLILILEDTNSTIQSQLLLMQGATFDTATDSLEAIRNNQAGADVAAIASAVWSLPLVDFTTAGTAGANLLSTMNMVSSILEDTNSTLSSQLILILEDTNSTILSQIRLGVLVSALDADVIGSAVIAAGAIDKADQLIGLNDLSVAQVNTEVATALATYDPATHTELIGEIDAVQTDIAALNNLSQNEVSTIVTSAMANLGVTVSAIGADVIGSAVIAAGAISKGDQLIGLNDLAQSTVVSGIWDALLTGSTFNLATSAGRRLRSVDIAIEVHQGTAQAGTSNTITFDTGAEAVDGIYDGDRVIITGGTGIEEHGIIISYVGSTRVATMAEDWVITPDDTSEFEIVPASVDVKTWVHNIVTASGGGLPDVNVNEVADASQTAGDLVALIATMDANVDLILADTGTDGVVIATGAIGTGQFAAGAIDAAALATDAGTEIANAVWATVLESAGSLTAKQISQVCLAALAGVTADGGATLKTPDGTTTRITAVIDGSNNRTTMTLNV